MRITSDRLAELEKLSGVQVPRVEIDDHSLIAILFESVKRLSDRVEQLETTAATSQH